MVGTAARWIKGLTLAVGLLAAAYGAASASQPQLSPPVSPAGMPSAELLRAAEEVVATGPKLARVWPGYWPRGQAFIIYAPGKGALLVAEKAGPSDYAPLPASALPKALRGRAWYRPGNLEGITRPFVIDYPIGEGRTAILVLARGGDQDLPGLIFHEQFHAYQHKAFKGRRGSQFIAPTAVADRVAFAADAETERRVLAASIAARTKKERIALLRQYLSLRREREASVKPAVLAVERQFELIEGTAKFVDRTAKSLGPSADKNLQQLLVEFLGEDLMKSEGAFASSWFRSRGYSVGAALTWHLRALDPKGWQRTIEAGANLDEAVAALVGFDGIENRAALAQEARTRFGHAAIRAALEPRIRAAAEKEIETVDEFYALGPYRLIVEIPRREGTGKFGMGFATGPGGMANLAESQLVLPDPEVVNATFPGGSLTVRERPFMSEGGAVTRYTILLAAAPTLNGGAAPGPGEHRFERLELSSPGVELKLAVPVRVTAAAGALIVQIP